MTLPPNFKHWDHLKDMLRRDHNKLVARYFKDLGSDWQPEINSNRGALRIASTIDDKDTSTMVLLRLYYFYEVLGYSRSGLAIFHGSTNDLDPPVSGHPKICFYFSQDAASVPDKNPKLDAEYSFRLTSETQSTITESKAKALATEIKNLFVENKKGIILTKGKTQYLYFYKEKGYRLRIYGNTESDAVDIIKKLLQLTNTPYDQDRLTVATPKRPNTGTPEKHTVYGKSVSKKKFRPTSNVRFRYAYMEIPGKKQPVFLVDTTYRHFPLVSL